MLKENNQKGFSLVELIASMAILIIVGAALLGFLSYCINQYRRSSAETSLQMEAQSAKSRLQDVVLQADVGIAINSGNQRLSLFSGDQAHPVKTEIKLDRGKHTLVYTEYELDASLVGSPDKDPWIQVGETQIFASFVDAWQVHIYDENGAEITDTSKMDTPTPAKVEISMDLGNEKRTYSQTFVTALRSKIVASNKKATYILAGKEIK